MYLKDLLCTVAIYPLPALLNFHHTRKEDEVDVRLWRKTYMTRKCLQQLMLSGIRPVNLLL